MRENKEILRFTLARCQNIHLFQGTWSINWKVKVEILGTAAEHKQVTLLLHYLSKYFQCSFSIVKWKSWIVFYWEGSFPIVSSGIKKIIRFCHFFRLVCYVSGKRKCSESQVSLFNPLILQFILRHFYEQVSVQFSLMLVECCQLRLCCQWFYDWSSTVVMWYEEIL